MTVNFEYFEQQRAPIKAYTLALPEVIAEYHDKLPNVLLDNWQRQGWCSYASGLFWTVNPKEYKDFVQEWFTTEVHLPIVFARTAFGNLFIWHKQQVLFVSVHYGWTKNLTDDIEVFFNGLLCTKSYRDKGLRGLLFDKALKKSGVLEPDECYAFVPALALGGSENAKSLQKVKLREYLLFLLQLHH